MTLQEYEEMVHDQRMRALQSANHVREARKRIKRELRTRQVELAALISEPPAVLETVEIGDMLEWTPGIGKAKVRKILGGTGISRTVTLGALSGASRHRIINHRIISDLPGRLML
jgi:hypothetical protein